MYNKININKILFFWNSYYKYYKICIKQKLWNSTKAIIR